MTQDGHMIRMNHPCMDTQDGHMNRMNQPFMDTQDGHMIKMNQPFMDTQDGHMIRMNQPFMDTQDQWTYCTERLCVVKVVGMEIFCTGGGCPYTYMISSLMRLWGLLLC